MFIEADRTPQARRSKHPKQKLGVTGGNPVPLNMAPSHAQFKA